MTNKLKLSDMLENSGVDLSVLKSVDKDIKSGVAFGIKAKMADLLIEYARNRKVTLLSVLPAKEKKKLSSEAQKEARSRKVSVINWKIARLCVQDEVRRMNKNVDGKGPIDRDIAEQYGVYRTDDKGRFRLVPKMPGSRQQQMVSLVAKAKVVLAAKDADFVSIGADDELTLVIE